MAKKEKIKKSTDALKLSKEEIKKRSKNISQIVYDFKLKMKAIKKKQHIVINNYVKSVEKLAIDEIRKQLK